MIKRGFLGLLLLVAMGILILQMNACTLGYTKLTMHKIRNDTTWVLYHSLPKKVSDTLIEIFEKYHLENKGLTFPVYDFPELVSLDTTVEAEIIKYQSFDSEKLRLAFGYFFRFGRKKYFIPYGEQSLNPPFVYLDSQFYFLGNHIGEVDEMLPVKHPDYYKVDFTNCYYVVYKMRGRKP